MEALLELAPRDAGTDPGEPRVSFMGGRSLHDVVACPVSCKCSANTAFCPVTGTSKNIFA